MITSPPRVNRCSAADHGVGPELDRVGKATLRRFVDKQIESGVDIGNNGEQQREAFFLTSGIG